eukprot:CAMPEP_0177702906 /NCGR_PEP_ID=MMETSP0484_2-20121128/7381_1 /TAXON_ID=354590 /ORGANISM="Rhodomonas lens, Strain RHODO" /LENGTH=281 /DNA_ID=CAMNT_0019214211 /DNA_START=145 /DNA_END=987 /DNA_ORIENTATION=-
MSSNSTQFVNGGLDDGQAGPADPAGGEAATRSAPAKRRFAMVEEDKNFEVFSNSTRHAICPFQVFEKYVFTILNLGTIIPDLPGYNTPKYIYPVGYKGLRSFPSLHNPETLGSYIFEIGYGGVHGPVFVVQFCEDDDAFIGETPDLSWQPVLHRLREKGMECPAWINGHALFGLTSREVQRQIAMLPGANAAHLSSLADCLQPVRSARTILSELQQAERILQMPVEQHSKALAEASAGHTPLQLERVVAAIYCGAHPAHHRGAAAGDAAPGGEGEADAGAA